MNDEELLSDWRLLDWEYACTNADTVEKDYKYRDDMAEYGLDWYEYINTYESEIIELISKWWSRVRLGERRGHFERARSAAKIAVKTITTRLANIEAALEKASE